jgi:hypothetical protein
MDSEAGKNGNKYDWQSWPADSLEGMPPKRRRLVVWGLWWFLFLGVLLGSVLDAAKVPQPWRTLLVIAGIAALFGPLIRGAMIETRQLRAEGIVMPPYPITRKSLISVAVITTILWVVFAFLFATSRPTFPLLPIVGTVWLAYQLLRLRSLPHKKAR